LDALNLSWKGKKRRRKRLAGHGGLEQDMEKKGHEET
jgi:hypothetical protein